MLDGGDFCGLQAKFDAITGKPKALPSYLVPESLKEWGQEPSCLEVIISEDSFDNRNRDWARQTLIVMPETGCGVDNLQTSKTVENYDTHEILTEKRIRSLVHFQADDLCFVESTFAADDGEHRVRIGCTVNTQTHRLAGSIIVTLERMFDSESSGGSRADGGGLDSQSVSRWLGDLLRKKHEFAHGEVSTPTDGSTDGRVYLPELLSVRVSTINDKCGVEMTCLSQSVTRLFDGNIVDIEYRFD